MKKIIREQKTLLAGLAAGMALLGLLLIGGCNSAPPADLVPQDLYGVWKMEPEKGKKVTTLMIFWPQYFARITGKNGKLSQPMRKIRYTMDGNEEQLTIRSVLMPLDPPYELKQDMTMSRTWPNAATFTGRGKEHYTKLTAAQANELLVTWKIESLVPEKLESMPSGEQ